MCVCLFVCLLFSESVNVNVCFVYTLSAWGGCIGVDVGSLMFHCVWQRESVWMCMLLFMCKRKCMCA